CRDGHTGGDHLMDGVRVDPVSSITAVPTLAEIQGEPAILEGLALDTLLALQRQVRHLDVDLEAAIARQMASRRANAGAEPDRLLLIEEAAAMLKTSVDSLYSKWSKLPFAFKDPLDGKIKFRLSGIERYITGRTGRRTP